MASPFRAKWILLVVALVVAIIGGYFVWQYLSQWESTDDAQVKQEVRSDSGTDTRDVAVQLSVRQTAEGWRVSGIDR